MRGFSLAESVFALFLLVLGFFVLVALFHLSLRYTALTEKQVLAATLAQNKLQEIRAWARTPSNFANNWSTYDNVTTTDPESNFRITTRSAVEPLFSACSQTESVQPPGDQKRLASSARKLEIKVQWDPPSPANQLTVTTLVGEPLRQINTVNVRIDVPGPDPLPQNQSVILSAHAMDAGNSEIPDVQFRFYPEPSLPIAATGTIENDRNGRVAVFTHKVRRQDATWDFGQAGQCRVRARAVYGGTERWGFSPVINLQ